MPRNTEITASITERILEAATRIVALYTELPAGDVRFICDKVYRLTMAEFGYSENVPNDATDSTRMTIFRRAGEMLREELLLRKVPQGTIEEMLRDLEGFYRGVRNIPPET